MVLSCLSSDRYHVRSLHYNVAESLKKLNGCSRLEANSQTRISRHHGNLQVWLHDIPLRHKCQLSIYHSTVRFLSFVVEIRAGID